jgi:phosphopantetheinyl transferase
MAPPAVREAAPRGPRGPRVDLRLSVPLVRLPPELTLTPARTALPGAAAGAAAGPVGAQHDALLAETLAASHAVLAALEDRQLIGDSPADQSSGPVEGVSTTEVVRIGLHEQPWLADHAFYRQAAGWPDDVDRFPVMPIATMVEMLADAARRAAPGRVVTGIEQIRAFKWLPAAPPIDVVVRATPDGGDRVDVAIEGYARATAVLGDRALPSPPPMDEPLRAARPSTLDADAVYRNRWMFHGPTFQGLRRIDAVGVNGVDGEIEALPTPGATLDNAGQLYGWWVMENVDRDFLALPESIERIELFQPLPVGARVTTRVRDATLGDRTVRANLELLHGGAVAVRVTGWVSRRFESDPHLWEMLRFPEQRLLATITPQGFAVVDERWRDGASRELMARRYLSGGERAQYETWNPRAQRLRLLGRVAAKDALRAALWAEGHDELYPAEVPLANDEHGAPHVVAGPATGLPVSIAHTEWLGVALVGTRGGPAVGIDAELVAPRGEAAIAAVLAPAERELIDARFGPARADEGFTRAWAAKEAVAKAAGTGLGGRPKDFVITDIDGDRIEVSGRWVVSTVVRAPAQSAWDASFAPNPDGVVTDAERKEYVIAWTDRT